MKIPQAADKWIVLAALVGLQAINFPYGADPGPFQPLAWVVECVGAAVLLTLVYVVWSGSWRLITRRSSENVQRYVRVCANAMFFVFAMVAFYTPIHTVAVALPVPAEINAR